MKIKLSRKEKKQLRSLSNQRVISHQVVLRARIILFADKGHRVSQIARALNINRTTADRWIERWGRLSGKVMTILEKLDDADRSGSPATYSPEQICQLVSMACASPVDYGRPISHWTPRELADEMIVQSHVDSISARHVGRLLNEADLKPHRMRYYLATEKDDKFDERVRDVCDIYSRAPEITMRGGKVISCDEKCGIQALERTAPDKPMKPGQVERHEFNYKRHGTLNLTANFDIGTGQVLNPTLAQTRNEKDFVEHIIKTISAEPLVTSWHFVLDNLNTHQSESLVRMVAQREGTSLEALGIKGQAGILKSMKTRCAYLCDPSHQVIFHYTPKHSSWLNQIEIWFSILARKLIKRASFKSISDLRERLLSFITYFNNTMAKPFRWTYKGKVLAK